MARYKQMRYRMLNWADWKVRQKDGIGRYARMRWEAPTDPEARMPWEADVVRPDEQDAWEIDKALRSIALPTELRATVECYYPTGVRPSGRSWSACRWPRAPCSTALIGSTTCCCGTCRRRPAAWWCEGGVLRTVPNRYICAKLGVDVDA